MKLYQFPKNNRSSTAGLFWTIPVEAQRARIVQLANRRLSLETISLMVRLPMSEVRSIVEGAPNHPRRKEISLARMSSLTPDGIAAVTGLRPATPLSDELKRANSRELLAKLLSNAWPIRR